MEFSNPIPNVIAPANRWGYYIKKGGKNLKKKTENATGGETRYILFPALDILIFLWDF